MNAQETREKLIENFKNHLLKSRTHAIENEKRYVELHAESSGAYVCWSLQGEWYVEAELYDQKNIYEQRKVILNLFLSLFLNIFSIF